MNASDRHSRARAAQPTLEQVARRTGVSMMTVSRALRGGSAAALVKPSTRHRIEKMATQLGYRPNTAARAIATGRFNTVALLLDARIQRDHTPPRLIYGIQQALEERGLRMLVAHLSEEHLTSDRHLPTILNQLLADGLVINFKQNVPDRLRELIDQHRIPAVWIESELAHDCVTIGNAAAAAEAVRHLVELGHRKIAFADNHPPDAMSHQLPESHHSLGDRRAGYVQAMRDAGLTPRLIGAEGASRTPGHERVAWARQWLQRDDRPTAVITYVTATALPVAWAAMSLGLTMPGDLSLITFAAEHETFGLNLSRLVIPEYAAGQTAVEKLWSKIESRRLKMPSTVLPLRLETGGTCAPPRTP